MGRAVVGSTNASVASFAIGAAGSVSLNVANNTKALAVANGGNAGAKALALVNCTAAGTVTVKAVDTGSLAFATGPNSLEVSNGASMAAVVAFYCYAGSVSQ